jgi:hypothetical protein
MTFRDLMEKYKAGSATSEERYLVESEIDKSELINEYLSEQLMDAIPDIKNKGVSSDEKSDTKKIKKTMNRKLRNVVIISVAIVVALFCGVEYVVFPQINNSYYNPLEGRNYSHAEWGQMAIDMSVFSELHFRGYETPFIFVKSEGLGTYDLTLYQYDKFRNFTETQYSSRIVRGKLDRAMLDDALVRGLGLNWVQGVYGDHTDIEKITIVNSASKAELARLPESAQVKAYLFFYETMDMKALAEFCKQDDLHVLWAWIKCVDYDTLWDGMFGFSPLGKYIPLTDESYDAELYPLLELDDSQPQGGVDAIDFNKLTATAYERHFTSLLKYMSEKSDFTDILGFNYDYSAVLSYVRQNGVQCNGIVVSGNRDTIEKISNDPVIQYIAIDDVMVSMFARD